MKRNLQNKSIIDRVEINFEAYMKINNSKFCLTNDMRYFFLGIKEKKYSSFESQDSQDEDENIVNQGNVKGSTAVKY